MDSLRCSLPADRSFSNFLLALTKRIYYNDKTYTDDVINLFYLNYYYYYYYYIIIIFIIKGNM